MSAPAIAALLAPIVQGVSTASLFKTPRSGHAMRLDCSQIRTMHDSPLDVYKKAAEVLAAHSALGAAYVAVVTLPEEPDYAWPEGDGDEGDGGDGGAGAAGAETDDEVEDMAPAAPAAEDGEEGDEGDAKAEEPVDAEVRRALTYWLAVQLMSSVCAWQRGGFRCAARRQRMFELCIPWGCELYSRSRCHVAGRRRRGRRAARGRGGPRGGAPPQVGLQVAPARVRGGRARAPGAPAHRRQAARARGAEDGCRTWRAGRRRGRGWRGGRRERGGGGGGAGAGHVSHARRARAHAVRAQRRGRAARQGARALMRHRYDLPCASRRTLAKWRVCCAQLRGMPHHSIHVFYKTLLGSMRKLLALQVLSGQLSPRGGYAAAAAVSPATGRYTAILAGDTLTPHGTGAPVATADEALLWEVARAVAENVDQFAAGRAAARKNAEFAPLATIAQLRDEMKALRADKSGEKDANAAGGGEEGGDGDADGALTEDADVEENEEEKADEEEAGDGNGDDADGEEGGEEGDALPAVNHAARVAKLVKKVRNPTW